jgi:hypothetical protein
MSAKKQDGNPVYSSITDIEKEIYWKEREEEVHPQRLVGLGWLQHKSLIFPGSDQECH